MIRPAQPPPPEYTTSAADGDGYWAGVRLRVVRHRVEWWSPVVGPEVTRGGEIAHEWDRAPMRALTRHYAAGSALWTWLRSHGVTRVSTTSGPSGYRDRSREAPRPSRPSPLRLSTEATAALAELAAREGTSRVAVVERLVLGAAGR